MRHLSIRLKITLWFAAALAVIVLLTLTVVLSASNTVLQKTIRDSLLTTVEDNVDEVEFLSPENAAAQIDKYDHYIAYGAVSLRSTMTISIWSRRSFSRFPTRRSGRTPSLFWARTASRSSTNSADLCSESPTAFCRTSFLNT